MLQNMSNMLEQAKKNHYAVAHFNINNLEWTKFILEVCQETNTPGILGVSEGAIKHMGGYITVSRMVQGLLQDLDITIPVSLHLDHGSSFETCKKAIDAGFTSVMIDASKYILEENIRITKQVVQYAHANGVTVEAEIGAVGGEEDGIANELAYAKVEEAEKLVEESGIDFLAPALGSVHGIYKGEPKLDFVRMKKIQELTNLPLVLHGGSGIPDEVIKKAISCGICKINVNTELQMAWAKKIREYLEKDLKVYDPRKIIKSGETALKQIVREKIILFGCIGKA